MALIIEDGTVVAGANSFVTDAELQAYAAVRKVSLPAAQDDREALLVNAMDYIVSKEQDMKGARVSDAQELPYPRHCVTINGFDVPKDSIPPLLKQCQIESAIAANTLSLLPNESVQNVQTQKVDVLEISYFQGGSMTTVNLQAVDAKIKPLLKNNATMTRV